MNIICILKVRKIRPRTVKSVIKGLIASKWRNRDFISGYYKIPALSRLMFLTHKGEILIEKESHSHADQSPYEGVGLSFMLKG